MLTNAQLQTLKTYIANDVTLNAYPMTSDGAYAIAQAMNLLAAPVFIVWRTNVSSEEYRKAFVWTEVDSMTTGKARIIEWMTGSFKETLNPSDINVRQGIADAFAANTTTRANLLALSKRSATRAEKLFAAGTGSDADPATMGWEGSLSFAEVMQARTM